MPEQRRVHSVNMGSLQTIDFAGLPVTTGIFKHPVQGSVSARRLGLLGDVQADLRVHGGLDKAVYFYPREHYAVWETLLGTSALAPGSFGENITSEGLSESDLYVGDVLRIGSAQFQVLQPRSPCYKLQAKFQRPDMVALFVKQNRPGWYTSVLQEGIITAGDEIEIVARANERISIGDVWRFSLGSEPDVETQMRISELALLPDFWKERILRR